VTTPKTISVSKFCRISLIPLVLFLFQIYRVVTRRLHKLEPQIEVQIT